MYLPKPYPDELIGSVLIRGHRRSGLRLSRFLCALIGDAIETHSMFTTTNPRIAIACGMAIERLLKEHTLLPYALAFRPHCEREALFTQYSTGLKGRTLGSLVQKMAPHSRRLAFCAVCAAEERTRYGEPYWHCEHQISGFLRCLRHLTPLEFTVSDVWIRRSSLPGEVPTTRLLACKQLPTELQWRLCSSMRSALNWHVTVHDDSPLRYRRACKPDGYWRSSRLVKGGLLSKDVAAYYGAAFLDHVGCAINPEFDGAWPARMLRHPGQNFSTVKHILLSTFLETPGL